MRVFLDANILFSAAKSDGAVRAMLRLLVDRGHDCRTDTYVVAEARRNLAAKGPQALDLLDALLAQLQIAAASPTAERSEELDWLPEKDRPVLAAAIRRLRRARRVGESNSDARPSLRRDRQRRHPAVPGRACP